MKAISFGRVSPFIATVSLVGVIGCIGAAPRPGMEPGPGVKAGKKGTFEAVHEFVIKAPEGASVVKAWLPIPADSDRMQKVESFRVESPVPDRIAHDELGNRYLYVERGAPAGGDLVVRTTFSVTRSEVNADVDPAHTRPHTPDELAQLGQYLVGSSQSVIDDNARELARTVVGNETNPVRIARQVYDAVLERVEYHVKDPKPDAQKTMKATGTGSSQKCFETCTGNCTDFHSLYAAVARAAGLPTREVYGSFFKGPLDGQDKDQSYHCWIEFHAPNIGWIPLDVAVADIFVADFHANDHSRPRAELTVANGYNGPSSQWVEYYFGNLEERRVSWHWGRDLVLDPPQAGPPLFWNATGYAEADGKPVQVVRKLTYRQVKEVARR
ncbi:MAG: transglutaminase family protein [Planctomycetota bacterium]